MPARLPTAAALVVAAAAVALGSSRAGWAQSRHLAGARAAFDAGEFDGAIVAFERVLADASARAPEVADAHRHLATIRSAAGDAAAAEAHAAAALAIDPALQPPRAASPEARALFERVRAARGGARVNVSLALAGGRVVAGRPAALRVRVGGAPAALQGRLDARCSAGAAQLAAYGGSAVDGAVDVPVAPAAHGATLDCRARVATGAGALLSEAALQLPVVVDEAPTGAVDAREVLAPRRATGGPNGWAVVGGTLAGLVVLGGAVTVVALAASGAFATDARFGAVELDPR